VTDLVALRLHLGRNGPQRSPLRPQLGHLADRLLLGLMLHQLASLAASAAERVLAAKEPAARLLIRLHL
jgi:hypothetical protein